MLASAIFLLCLSFGYVEARLMFLELNVSTPEQYSEQLNNQHIVMIGDSLMRYQYLSLVHLIHRKSFSPIPNILEEKQFLSWIEFYDQSNGLFAPNEYCDCFRSEHVAHITNIYENRYYHNNERNITISYIQYFGDRDSQHGHWQPSNNETNLQFHKPDHEFITPTWINLHIKETIVNIASKLLPKPSVLLLNAGHWRNDWNLEAHRNTVLSTAVPLFHRVIWKTTNFMQTGQRALLANEEACNYPGVECMNLDWTQYLLPNDYADDKHYHPHVYADINIQFIHQLLHKQPLLVAPMNKEYIGHVVVAKGKQYIVDSRGLLRSFEESNIANATLRCVVELTKRTHTHMHVSVLVKHLLGEKLTDVCSFQG